MMKKTPKAARSPIVKRKAACRVAGRARTKLRQVRMRFVGLGGERRSGDDVRRDLVFDEGDTIAQLQLAFFQSL